MADLCTLPWLFVPTGPCRDCLPTLPHLKKKNKKWGMSRKMGFIHKNSQANDKSCSQEAGSEGHPPSNPGLASPAAWGVVAYWGCFYKLEFGSSIKSCCPKLPTSNLIAVNILVVSYSTLAAGLDMNFSAAQDPCCYNVPYNRVHYRTHYLLSQLQNLFKLIFDYFCLG